jgi:hypothetical protein
MEEKRLKEAGPIPQVLSSFYRARRGLGKKEKRK